jgi:hypothetical protein
MDYGHNNGAVDAAQRVKPMKQEADTLEEASLG